MTGILLLLCSLLRGVHENLDPVGACFFTAFTDGVSVSGAIVVVTVWCVGSREGWWSRTRHGGEGEKHGFL